MINGEPTESHQAIATKGALRVTIEAKGRTAHSAYPELGESAIEKLLDILNDIRRYDWPVDAELGPTTYNIGTISGGRKPNVVPDFASSEVMFRIVTDPDEMFEMISEVVAGRAETKRGFTIPTIRASTEPMARACAALLAVGGEMEGRRGSAMTSFSSESVRNPVEEAAPV